jgi:hypothetical protein
VRFHDNPVALRGPRSSATMAYSFHTRPPPTAFVYLAAWMLVALGLLLTLAPTRGRRHAGLTTGLQVL